MRVGRLAGGIPSDPNVAEGWIRTKVSDHDDLIREAVAETMMERGITAEQAAEEVARNRHLNGFKRHETTGELYIEGRQLKAGIKEAASVCIAAGKLTPDGRTKDGKAGKGWGVTNKSLVSFIAEHVQVVEDRLYLGVKEPSGIAQRFVHTWRGSGIQYEEIVNDVDLSFTISSDYAFSEEFWGILWLTAEQQGIGASRSQGYGRYEVREWEPTIIRPTRASASRRR